MNNTQIPMLVEDNYILKVFEIFSTIQGEGPFVGHRATFIRLYGCNLQCPLCDTDYTSEFVPMTASDILTEVDQYENELIVITGGEPYRQDITMTVGVLLSAGYKIQIETNGTIVRTLPREIIIVCSPKMSYIPPEVMMNITHYKYVIHHKHISTYDGLPTMALALKVDTLLARPPKDFPRELIYVQPVETGVATIDERNLQAAVASCREFGYTLCLQLHKIINMP